MRNSVINSAQICEESENGVPLIERPTISPAVQQFYLRKIINSATFARAEQLRRLLLWLGERSLTPHPTSPSEQEVGFAVLHRRDFDPQTDSLVRKEMSRLREKLNKYYLLEGKQDEIRLNSGGGYLLRFEWHHHLQSPANLTHSHHKSLLVLPMRSDGLSISEVRQFLESLQLHLVLSERFELISPTTARRYSEQSGDVRKFAHECGAEFVLEGTTWRTEVDYHAILWVVSGQSGRTTKPFFGHSSEIGDLSESLARRILASF